jgi:hypothetical protein
MPSLTGELNITMTSFSVSRETDCTAVTFAQQMMPNGVLLRYVLRSVRKKCVYSSEWVCPLEVQQHLQTHVQNVQLCV